MAGCSAVRTRRTCKHNTPGERTPSPPAAGPGSHPPAAPVPAHLQPALQIAPCAQAYLEAGELGLDVLLRQMQPGLPEEDAQSPEPEEGGGTDDGVDPERHALRRDLGGAGNAAGLPEPLAARLGLRWGSPSRTSPCPSPRRGTHISGVVVPVSRQHQPQEDGGRPQEGVLESPQHQQPQLAPGTGREVGGVPGSPAWGLLLCPSRSRG